MSHHDQNSSFISNQSRKSSLPHQHVKKKKKIEPYISPFILSAKRTADERAKKAMLILKQNRQRPIANEWDQSTRTPGLFDPSIRKKEIFRIEPRKRTPDRPVENRRVSTNSVDENTNYSNRTNSNRVTIRTTNLTPRRPLVPEYSPNPNVVRATHPLNLSRERRSFEIENRSVEKTPVKSVTAVSEGTDPIDFNNTGLEKEERVSRSVSPINEKIVGKILEDEQRNPPSQQPILRDLFLSSKDPRKDYGDLIRERLKLILQRHRLGIRTTSNGRHSSKSAEDTEEYQEEDFYHPPYYRPSRYYYPHGRTMASPRLDVNQVYTRDMMASMATIMSAVGDILVKRSHKDYWRHAKRKRSKSSPPVITVNETPVVSIPSISSMKSPQKLSNINQPSSSSFVHEMAQILTQKPVEALPKSKSVIVDKILQKLQSIEKCESEISEYLKQNRSHPSHNPHSSNQNEENHNLLQDLDEPSPRSPKHLPTPSTSSLLPLPLSPSRGSSLINHPAVSSTSMNDDTALTKQVLSRLNQASHDRKQPQALHHLLPNLHDVGCDQVDAIQDYLRELSEAQQLKEAIYDRKDTTMAITVDTISDILFDRVVYSVANEVEHVIDDYAQKVLQKI